MFLRSGIATFVSADRPGTAYGAGPHAKLPIRSGSANDYVQFGLPTDLVKGALVLSATLRVQQNGDWSTATTLTVRRVGPWKPRTLTWNNQPALDAAATNVAVTGAATTPDKNTWAFNVTADVQAFVDGTPNNGWRVTSGSTATGRYLRGFAASNGAPTLEVTYSYPPAAPTTLHPSAGAVSIPKPVLRFDASAVAAVRVQVDPAANETTPGFDSGWVTTTKSELDLAATTYAGLANNASTQWRVKVRNTAGQESPWSRWVTFNRVDKPAATFSQPTATIWESTPPIQLNMTGMVKMRIWVTKTSDPATVLYDTGEIPSTTGAHTPPKPVFKTDGQSYVVRGYGWDNVVREATPGDPVWSEASVTTTLAYDAGVTGVSSVVIEQEGLKPFPLVKFTRAVQPDAFTIVRDGVIVAADLVPADLLVSGTYVFRDWTAPPNTAPVYRPAAVVNSRSSADGAGQTATLALRTVGVWLAHPASGAYICLNDAEVGLVFRQDADVAYPLGSDEAVRDVTGTPGFEGPISGVLAESDFDTRPVEQQLADAETIRAAGGEFRLTRGTLNLPVMVGAFAPLVTTDDWTPVARRYTVSFECWQRRAA